MPEKEQQEEYELIPISPLRRLEKRMEEVESTSGMDKKEFFKEMVDIIRMNQQLDDEIAQANDALRIELSKLPGRLEDLTNSVKELVSYIRASATEEISGISSDTFQPLTEKLNQFVEANKKTVETNETIINLLKSIEKKLGVATFQRPMLPPRPLLPR